MAPDPAKGAKGVQLPSGVGVLPCRTLRLTLVPAGSVFVHVALPQGTLLPASNTRDVKVPVAA